MPPSVHRASAPCPKPDAFPFQALQHCIVPYYFLVVYHYTDTTDYLRFPHIRLLPLSPWQTRPTQVFHGPEPYFPQATPAADYLWSPFLPLPHLPTQLRPASHPLIPFLPSPHLLILHQTFPYPQILLPPVLHPRIAFRTVPLPNIRFQPVLLQKAPLLTALLPGIPFRKVLLRSAPLPRIPGRAALHPRPLRLPVPYPQPRRLPVP